MSFSAKLYENPSDLLPRRSRTHIPAEIAGSTDRPHYIVVHNLSSEGMLIEAYHGVHVGAAIVFDIPGLGRHLAHAVWNDGAFFDCTFDRPVDAGLVRQKLTDSKVVWGDFRRRPARRPASANDQHPAPVATLPAPAGASTPRAVPAPARACDPDLWDRVGDADPRWSRPTRFALIFGGGALGWGLPILLIRALMS